MFDIFALGFRGCVCAAGGDAPGGDATVCGGDSARVLLSPSIETSTEHRNKHRALKQEQGIETSSEHGNKHKALKQARMALKQTQGIETSTEH